MLTMLYDTSQMNILTIKKEVKKFANIRLNDKKGKNTSQISKEVKINLFTI